MKTILIWYKKRLENIRRSGKEKKSTVAEVEDSNDERKTLMQGIQKQAERLQMHSKQCSSFRL